MLNEALRKLEQYRKGYYAERILSQLGYLAELDKAKGEHNAAIAKAASALLQKADDNGAITKADCDACEAELAGLSSFAKTLTVMPIGHAHIDMNWMWGYDETVEITLETFRTVLKLMDELPEFTFAQSQASTYHIVEQYDPTLLPKIAARIKEGRWEVSASMWTEGDKNIANGESISRHMLYTKQYMKKLFDLNDEDLQVDFEPDTFGHSANIPEILNQGGVKYLYHCRGYDGEHFIYRWKAQSGANVLVYRDPAWYNVSTEYKYIQFLPGYCAHNKVDAMMLVYGVGDHGGGPTKRDINRLLDMKTWPLAPTITFGTYHKYFKHIENGDFPVVDAELNYVFTGCYTTQSRIKAANKLGENSLYEAEAAAAIAAKLGGFNYKPIAFENAWRKVLFSQFHDILPGSCIITGREYCSGTFQEVMATANTEKVAALRAIAANIDTTAINPPEGECYCESNSEGAGVGFRTIDYRGSYTELGKGDRRGYILFNTTQFDKTESNEIIVWDYDGDNSTIVVKDAEGNHLPFDIVDSGEHHFWAHNYVTIRVYATIPAFGYKLIVVDRDYNADLKLGGWNDPRTEAYHEYILSNDKIEAVINPVDGSIASITDKATGEILLEDGSFNYVIENSNGMSAWVVGRHSNVVKAFDITNISKKCGKTGCSVTVTGKLDNNKIEYTYSLDKDATVIKVAAKVDWLEFGNRQNGIPQLNFNIYTSYMPEGFVNDIPYGKLERESRYQDIPALSYTVAKNEKAPHAIFISCTKYAFRNYEDNMSLTLIRSAYNPDPYPELGEHKFEFAIGLCNGNEDALSASLQFPCTVISVTPHTGSITGGSFIKASGASVGAVKLAEDNSGDMIIRLCNKTAASTDASLHFPLSIKSAHTCGINEQKQSQLNASGNAVSLKLQPYAVATLRITF